MFQNVVIPSARGKHVTKTEAYENLANAIIIQAIRDYESDKENVTAFIKSEWFGELTNISPDYIIKLCESGYGKNVQMGVGV